MESAVLQVELEIIDPMTDKLDPSLAGAAKEATDPI